MSSNTFLSDRVQLSTREVEDALECRMANGLIVRTDPAERDDPCRILPLGAPQGAMLNYLMNTPSCVIGREVFDPFAGSGVLGFMALKLGAAHVDFLDINARALEFQRENARLNGFSPDGYRLLQTDIREFLPDRKYGMVLANPPFVPAPKGVPGTLTSNGGPDGNDFVRILIDGLSRYLEDSGEALIYVLQFAVNGRPLVADLLESGLEARPVEITSTQSMPIPLETYLEGYKTIHPSDIGLVDQWRAELRAHGSSLALCHYIIHVQPRWDGPTKCHIRDNLAEKYGAGFQLDMSRFEHLPIDGRRR